ncbi:MAG: glycoside hydrolase [Chloroflexota bacterium]|nr:glycoside hydrolase [Chloroflexota bacterium]
MPSETPATGWEGQIFNRPDPPAPIEALATNGTVLVGVGSSGGAGAVWLLRTGADWERMTSVPSAVENEALTLIDVAAVESGFVAVGLVGAPNSEAFASVIWSSADGRSWREAERVDGMLLKGVAAGGPGALAVGGRGSGVTYPEGVAVLTSEDGATWSELGGVDAFGAAAFEDMVQTDGGLVAVGQSRAAGEQLSAAAWTSADGTTWEQAPANPLFDSSGMAAVTAAGPGLVAVGVTAGPGGSHGAIWTSADGVTWERPPFDDASATVNGVAGADAHIVVAGSVAGADNLIPAVWTSPDGLTWTAEPEVQEHGPGVLFDVIAFGGRVIAVGAVVGATPDETRPLVLTGPLPAE